MDRMQDFVGFEGHMGMGLRGVWCLGRPDGRHQTSLNCMLGSSLCHKYETNAINKMIQDRLGVTLEDDGLSVVAPTLDGGVNNVQCV